MSRAHDHAGERRAANLGTAGLGLFDVAPDIRTPAPAAPGSTSSQVAADWLDGPFRRASLRKIMLTLATLDAPISRADLAQRTGIPQHVLCARLADLRPMWVEAVDRACTSDVKPGLRVDGYKLTDIGRARVRAAIGERP